MGRLSLLLLNPTLDLCFGLCLGTWDFELGELLPYLLHQPSPELHNLLGFLPEHLIFRLRVFPFEPLVFLPEEVHLPELFLGLRTFGGVFPDLHGLFPFLEKFPCSGLALELVLPCPLGGEPCRPVGTWHWLFCGEVLQPGI